MEATALPRRQTNGAGLSPAANLKGVGSRTVRRRGRCLNQCHVGRDKCLRLRSDDGVSVGAQSSQSLGSPINQRECAGFNRPDFSVAARNPFGVAPETTQVDSSCRQRLDFFFRLRSLRAPCSPSCACGVGHEVGIPRPNAAIFCNKEKSLSDVRRTEA